MLSSAYADFGYNNKAIPKVYSLSSSAYCTGTDQVNGIRLVNNRIELVCSAQGGGAVSSGVFNSSYEYWNNATINAGLPLWYNYSNIINQTIANINSSRVINNANCSWSSIVGMPAGFADGTDDTGVAGASTPDYFEVDLSCENLLVDTFNSQTAIETGEVGLLGWGYTATGGSAAVATPTKGNHPGVIRLSTGTEVRGNITFELGQASRYWDSFSGNTTQTWVLNVSAPITTANNYSLYVGYFDNSGTVKEPVDCGGFFTNETVNGNWTAILCLNNARYLNITNWKVNATEYINLNFSVINQSGGKHRMNWYMRTEKQTTWTLVATSDALSPPNTVARATGPAVVLRKFGGTTAITADIDYYWDKSRFNVCR